MDWPELFTALSGQTSPLVAVVVRALGFWVMRLQKRNDTLVDKIIDMSASQTKALSDLTSAIERRS